MDINIAGLLIGVFALVVFIGGFVLAYVLWPTEEGGGSHGAAIGVAIAGVVLSLGILCLHPIQAGYVGVVTSFGKVQADTLKPGLNIVPPILNQVTDVDTRVRGIKFGDDPNNRFGAASREYQDVFLTGTLNFHVDQNAAVNLYQQVGLDFDQKLVVPFFSTAIKEVVPQYAIGDILAKREEIRAKAVEKLAQKLQPYEIVVDDVAIANIDFSEQYKAAIEAKQVAEQQVATESQILAQKKKIQADQVRTSAQGQADAVLIAAQAQAKANTLLQQSLSPALIQYTLIQKLGPSITTILLPTGQPFILDPNALVPAK